MKKISIVLLALAGFVLTSFAADNYATRVVSYHPGTNFAAGFTNPAAVLGAPSRINPYREAADPFNPPYGKEQILSVGEGGSVTVRFRRAVHNSLHNPFGLDFNVFGNAGFIITNDFNVETFDWMGIPATDGSLFGAAEAEVRISVSVNGRQFYTLDPDLAPMVDGAFPTDGSGDFRLPVLPTLDPRQFAGATLEDIRDFYYGSAGGTGYNIAWARRANGRAIRLGYIRFVRIEVLSGRVELDGFCATAPVRLR